jgi:N-acetylglucosamine-6-phosphate deacetylase
MKPKFIELQVNGHGGFDLLSAQSVEQIRGVGRSLYKNGVVGYLPTIITSSLEKAIAAIGLIEEARKNPKSDEALILGIHLEGPFISIEKRGVHPSEFVTEPDRNHIDKLLGAGLVKLVTLAPEVPGAIELIKYLVANKIAVSLGHSNATKEEALAGFEAGATSVTHLFNAMPKSTNAGLVAAALENEEILIQIIVDNVHVPNEVLREILPKICNRFVLTNDPIAAAGLGDGKYPFGDMEIVVFDNIAKRSDGTLAGGVGNLESSLEILKDIGISDKDALASVTYRPCELIGLDYESVANNFL